jgi:hypothetical protein
MRRNAASGLAVGFAAIFFGTPAVQAQVAPVRQKLVCESLNRERKDCPARIRGNVRIVRLLGPQKCVHALNWRWTPSGITVTNNCRAEFEYDAEVDAAAEPAAAPAPVSATAPGATWTPGQRNAYDAGYLRGQNDARSRLSRNPQRHSADFDANTARFFHKGYEDGYTGAEREYRFAGTPGAWTVPQQDAYDRGYSAGLRDRGDNKNRNHKRYSREFSRDNESFFREGYEDAYDGRPRAYGETQTGATGVQTVTCESRDRRFTECPIDRGSRVRLLRALSTARCVEGETWGTRPGAIWVDAGCRAEFEVRPPRR